WNYEDGTFGPNEVTERIHAINASPGGGGLYVPQASGPPTREKLAPKFIKFFGPGPGARPDDPTTGAWLGSQATVQRWYDDQLFNNFGFCENDINKVCSLAQDAEAKKGYLPPGESCHCISS